MKQVRLSPFVVCTKDTVKRMREESVFVECDDTSSSSSTSTTIVPRAVLPQSKKRRLLDQRPKPTMVEHDHGGVPRGSGTRKLHRLLLLWGVSHNVPRNVLASDATWNFLAIINSMPATVTVKNVERPFVANRCSRQALAELETSVHGHTMSVALKRLSKCLSISVQSDSWTSRRMLGVECFTLMGTFGGVLVRVVRIVANKGGERHTGDNIKNKLMEVLKANNIDRRVVSFTTDTASNQVSGVRLAVAKLQRADALPTPPIQVKCAAHVLQLAIKDVCGEFREDGDDDDAVAYEPTDGLSVNTIVQSVLTTACAAVRLIRRSSVNMECFKQNGGTRLLTYSKTRFNTLFLMLESVMFSHSPLLTTLYNVGSVEPGREGEHEATLLYASLSHMHFRARCESLMNVLVHAKIATDVVESRFANLATVWATFEQLKSVLTHSDDCSANPSESHVWATLAENLCARLRERFNDMKNTTCARTKRNPFRFPLDMYTLSAFLDPRTTRDYVSSLELNHTIDEVNITRLADAIVLFSKIFQAGWWSDNDNEYDLKTSAVFQKHGRAQRRRIKSAVDLWNSLIVEPPKKDDDEEDNNDDYDDDDDDGANFRVKVEEQLRRELTYYAANYDDLLDTFFYTKSLRALLARIKTTRQSPVEQLWAPVSVLHSLFPGTTHKNERRAGDPPPHMLTPLWYWWCLRSCLPLLARVSSELLKISASECECVRSFSRLRHLESEQSTMSIEELARRGELKENIGFDSEDGRAVARE